METNQNSTDVQSQSMADQLQANMEQKSEEFLQIIKSLSEKLKDMPDLERLMNELYGHRQDCVDYLQKLMFASSKYSRVIKKKSAEKYKYYKLSAQTLFKSDAAINNQIEVDLEDYCIISDLLKVQIKVMEETLANFDNLGYAIKERIELHKILNGMKF